MFLIAVLHDHFNIKMNQMIKKKIGIHGNGEELECEI